MRLRWSPKTVQNLRFEQTFKKCLYNIYMRNANKVQKFINFWTIFVREHVFTVITDCILL